MTFDDIFYTAALLEKVARDTKNKRSDTAKYIGLKGISNIAEFAEVNHCLSLGQVADEVIAANNIPMGNFDTVSSCDYAVPSITDIGKVYARLVEDTEADTQKYPQALYAVLCSPLADMIADFNTAWFYTNRDELAYHYRLLMHQK